MELLSWALAPFLIPIGCVVVMFVIQSMMLLCGLGLDFLDGDFDFELEHDFEADHDYSFSERVLSPLGVGHVPLSIVWQTYFLSFGFSGISLSWFLSFLPTLILLPITIPVALVMGWFTTRSVIRFVAPLLRTSGVALGKLDLIGKHGRVTSLKVDDSFGEAVFEVGGSLNHMIVSCEKDESFNKGDQVFISGYDDRQRPLVTRLKQ